MDALEMALLFDYYGGMLTEKQRDCFDMRYNQDLSLGEIADPDRGAPSSDGREYRMCQTG